MERGITVPQGRRKLEQHVVTMLDSGEAQLSPRVLKLIGDMKSEWAALDQRIAAFDDEFAAQAKTNDVARRLASIPGIGVLNATALAAALGNAATFERGRDLAAWLGLVPRQLTTGGKPRLLGISKRGTKYLRKLLAHGARAALPSLSAGTTPLGKWLRGLQERAHKNTVIEALANKLARIIWAVLRHGGTYDAATVKAA
jgi:transposase